VSRLFSASSLRQAVPAPLPSDETAPQAGVVRFYSFLEPDSGFAADVKAGLAAPRKMIPGAWRFDGPGMMAYEALCGTPEYSLVRAERALLVRHSQEVLLATGINPLLIEMGPPAGINSGALIETLKPTLYLNVGMDLLSAQASAVLLSADHPMLNIAGMLAAPGQNLVLPVFPGVRSGRKVVFLSAAAAGCHTADSLSEVLRQAAQLAGKGGILIAGVGLQKGRRQLESAGNDAQGFAARLNRNLLQRINRELGGDFQAERFRHVAVHNEKLGCTGFYLESEFEQFAMVEGRRHDFAAGEVMLTGIASQFAQPAFERLVIEAGFTLQKAWADDARWVSVNLFTVT